MATREQWHQYNLQQIRKTEERLGLVRNERFRVREAFKEDAYDRIKAGRGPQSAGEVWRRINYLIHEYGVRISDEMTHMTPKTSSLSDPDVKIFLSRDLENIMSDDLIIWAGIGKNVEPLIKVPKEGKISFIIKGRDKDLSPLEVMPYDRMELEVKLDQLEAAYKANKKHSQTVLV